MSIFSKGVIEKIQEIYEEEFFDFRKYAYPNDELCELFEQWVDYYRLKYSICKAIKPQKILEVGVRYGYSAISFLEACKDAKYLGIDNDSSLFGGESGAINWARKITSDKNAEFILADTQMMDTFPGGYYDLIHIDGQQDGDGTIHDLTLALEKGKYILADGFFWTHENMMGMTHFLNKFKNFIEFATIIPGYAGELLIKKNENKNFTLNVSKYKNNELGIYYSSEYYLTDCGGYDVFIKNGGRRLDERLGTVALLTNPQTHESILDVGCGRGELAYILSQTGANVTGIDYSEDAVMIANSTYKPGIGKNLEYRCVDILNDRVEGSFDKIVLSDIIEHIEEEKLEILFANISECLKTSGEVIIHTAPNKYLYEITYETKRQRAKEIGIFLPKNPRTYYEDLMHINEQTVLSLKEKLQNHFKETLVWVTKLPDMIGSLDRKYSVLEEAQCESIFAIASNSTINKEKIMGRVRNNKLDSESIDVNIFPTVNKEDFGVNEMKEIGVVIQNNGTENLVSLAPFPVHLSYHWLREDGEMYSFEGLRTKIHFPIYSKGRRSLLMSVKGPKQKGMYTLRITLVQEGSFWFEDVNSTACVDISCTVE